MTYFAKFCKALLLILTLVVVFRAYQNIGVNVSTSTTFTPHIKLPSMTFCRFLNEIWPFPNNITMLDFPTVLTDLREGGVKSANLCYEDKTTKDK